MSVSSAISDANIEAALKDLLEKVLYKFRFRNRFFYIWKSSLRQKKILNLWNRN